MSKALSKNSSPLRVIKIASCPTSSGKTTLTYQVGCNAENEIHIRVVENTGGGLFSPEWLSIDSIQTAMSQAALPLTSFPLIKLLQGKSTNTPAFFMAALRNEGLVRNLEGKIRGFEILDDSAFVTEMNGLMATEVDLKVAEIQPEYKTSFALKKKVTVIKPSESFKGKKTSTPKAAYFEIIDKPTTSN